jgi:hypothetical protein
METGQVSAIAATTDVRAARPGASAGNLVSAYAFGIARVTQQDYRAPRAFTRPLS